MPVYSPVQKSFVVWHSLWNPFICVTLFNLAKEACKIAARHKILPHEKRLCPILYIPSFIPAYPVQDSQKFPVCFSWTLTVNGNK